MKFFTVFAAIVAVALASPAEWTLHELSTAIQNPSTPDLMVPILEEALSELMLDIFNGSPQTTTTVSSAVQDFSSWTLNELSEAIQDPATDPHLIVYLEHALNSMMADIFSGGQPEYVIVATPIGLLPIDTIVIPAPVEAVVIPTPVESVATPAASSPLVQIIVNIKNQEQTPIAPAPVVPVLPEIVVPEPVVLPQPVLPEVILPQPVVLPQPVLPEVILPQPVVLPQPVLPEVIVPQPVVLPQPVAPEVSPVEIVAINPGANPIDIIAPLPVVIPAGAVDIVGPIV